MAKDLEVLAQLTELQHEALTEADRRKARDMLEAFHAWPGEDTPPEVVEYLASLGAWSEG